MDISHCNAICTCVWTRMHVIRIHVYFNCWSSIVQLLNVMMRFIPNFLVVFEWVLSNWSGQKNMGVSLIWIILRCICKGCKHGLDLTWERKEKYFGNEVHRYSRNLNSTWNGISPSTMLLLAPITYGQWMLNLIVQENQRSSLLRLNI